MKKLTFVFALAFGLALSVALVSCATTKLPWDDPAVYARPELIAEWVEKGNRDWIDDYYIWIANSPQTIDSWEESGLYNFNSSYYAGARWYYYSAVLADRERMKALANYGACLTNLGLYSDAIKIYDLILRTDNDYHEIAISNLEATWQVMSQRSEQEQLAAVQWQQQQQQANLDALTASLNALSSSLAQAGNALGAQSNAGTATAQAQTPSTPTVNAAGYQNNYDRFRRQVESNLSSLRKLIEVNSRYSVAYNGLMQTLRANQRDMRNIRQEAARNGVTIVRSPLEDRDP